MQPANGRKGAEGGMAPQFKEAHQWRCNEGKKVTMIEVTGLRVFVFLSIVMGKDQPSSVVGVVGVTHNIDKADTKDTIFDIHNKMQCKHNSNNATCSDKPPVTTDCLPGRVEGCG